MTGNSFPHYHTMHKQVIFTVPGHISRSRVPESAKTELCEPAYPVVWLPCSDPRGDHPGLTSYTTINPGTTSM